MDYLQKTWHQNYQAMSTFGDRLADWVSEFVGSWSFVIVHVLWFGIWIVFKIESFPFGLLTMIVSLEAILLSTFIMMSQNRQADRDRAQAQSDYQTNIDAKNEIEEVQKAIYRIENDKLEMILKLLQEKSLD